MRVAPTRTLVFTFALFAGGGSLIAAAALTFRTHPTHNDITPLVFICGGFLLAIIASAWIIGNGQGLWVPPAVSSEVTLEHAACHRISRVPTGRYRGVEVRFRAIQGATPAGRIRAICVPRRQGLSVLATEEAYLPTKGCLYATCFPGDMQVAADLYIEIIPDRQAPNILRIQHYGILGTRSQWIDIHGGFEDLRGYDGGGT